MTPSRPSFTARFALVAFAALCVVWLARLDFPRKISTNVLDLLPPAEQSPEAALVRHLASDTQARVMLFALHDPHQPDTPPSAAAARFIAALRASSAFPEVVPLGDPADQQALGRALFARRHRLLLPTWLGQQHAAFAATGRPAADFSPWLAERAAADLEAFLARPEALSMEALIVADPLLLVPRLIERTSELAPAAGGHALIWARLAASPLSEEGQAPAFDAIAAALAAAQSAQPGVALQWTGVNRFAAASRARIEAELSTLNLGSLAAVLLVSIAFVRRPWRMLHVVPIILLSLLGAWSATTLAFERVHILVFVIGALLCGVAIDYAFYLYLQPPAHPLEDYSGKLRRLLKPLLASCLTTVIGFSLLLFSDLPLLRQMGLFVGAGLLCALAVAMTYFAQVHRPFLETRPIARPATRLSRRLLATAAAFALLVALVGMSRLRWRDDVRTLEIASPELHANDRAVRTLAGESTARPAYVTHGGTLAAARAHLADFLAHESREHPDVTPASLGELFPTEPDWLALPARLHGLTGFATEFRTALQRHGFDADSFHTFFAQWDELRSSPPAGDYTALYRDLAPLLRGPLAQLHDADGPLFWFLTLVPGAGAAPLPPELHTVPVRQLETLNALFTRYRTSALQLSAGGLALVIASVFVLYRGRTALRIAALPAGACAFVLGTFGLLGAPLNWFHLLGAFLGTCLSHNYAIFSSDTARGRHPPPTALRLSACTTAASFGVLAFSAIPVIHALGLTVAAIVLTTLAFIELEALRRPAP